MTTKEIKDLLKLVSELDLREVKISQKDFEIKIRTDKDQTTQVISGGQMMQQAAPMAVAPAPVAVGNQGVQTDVPATAEADASTQYIEIKSPMVGTFYRSASPDKPAYKQVGDSVGKGDVVCIIEAMKLFNEIESEVSGKIVKVLVDDSSPVEYDQVLFLVDPGA